MDSVKLLCPRCHKGFHLSLSFIQGSIKRMKMDKMYEVARQMHDKRGPFYDKWLAAMETRGEEMRCSDCLSHGLLAYGVPDNWCKFKLKVVNPSWFSCKHATFYQG